MKTLIKPIMGKLNLINSNKINLGLSVKASSNTKGSCCGKFKDNGKNFPLP